MSKTPRQERVHKALAAFTELSHEEKLEQGAVEMEMLAVLDDAEFVEALLVSAEGVKLAFAASHAAYAALNPSMTEKQKADVELQDAGVKNLVVMLHEAARRLKTHL